MAEVFLRRLSRWQAETQRESMADLYVEAYETAPGEEFHDRQGFLRRFEEDVQQPGFDMVIGTDPHLVGCVYGYRADRMGSWARGSVGHFPAEIEELTASGQVFVVAELMVMPTHRRRRTATHMVERLLTRAGTALAVALVAPSNAPARAAYASLSWSKLGDLDPAPGIPKAEVWAMRLAH